MGKANTAPRRAGVAAGRPRSAGRVRRRPVSRMFILLILTAFQLVSFFQVLCLKPLAGGEPYDNWQLWPIYAAYLAVEWLYVILSSAILRKKSFELEGVAFFLTGIGLAVVGSARPKELLTQFIAVLIGLAVFIGLTWFIGDIKRVMATRVPLGVAAILLLLLNLVVGTEVGGAKNWIFLGPISFQPSELVKVAFIFVGAATLEKLQSTRNLTGYLIFAVGCIGALFVMKDLGAALIFFFTFLIIAFMRSGDIRTIILVCVAAALGAAMIVTFKADYVMGRFASYRHVWEPAYMQAQGYQQTRVLIYAVSGGLLGVGIGNGHLRGVFAAESDLVFGMLCEEWGILTGLLVILVFAALTVYTVRCAPTARSSFYSISACAAAGLLLFQTCLNVFGVTDLLPLTGVTLPFISQGGSSIICAWGLFAFIKAADIRTYPKLYDEPEVVAV